MQLTLVHCHMSQRATDALYLEPTVQLPPSPGERPEPTVPSTTLKVLGTKKVQV